MPDIPKVNKTQKTYKDYLAEAGHKQTPRTKWAFTGSHLRRLDPKSALRQIRQHQNESRPASPDKQDRDKKPEEALSGSDRVSKTTEEV